VSGELHASDRFIPSERVPGTPWIGGDWGRGVFKNKLTYRYVQIGSGAHPATYPMGTGVSSPEVKRSGREADHSPLSSSVVRNAWSYTATPPTCRHGVVYSQAQLLLYLTFTWLRDLKPAFNVEQGQKDPRTVLDMARKCKVHYHYKAHCGAHLAT
jgi:hypothetical protein